MGASPLPVPLISSLRLSHHTMKTLFFAILLTLCVYTKGQDEKPKLNCDALEIVLNALQDAVDESLLQQDEKADGMPPMPEPADGDEKISMDDVQKAVREMIGNSTADAVEGMFQKFGLDDLFDKLQKNELNETEIASGLTEAVKAAGFDIEAAQKEVMEQCPDIDLDDDLDDDDDDDYPDDDDDYDDYDDDDDTDDDDEDDRQLDEDDDYSDDDDYLDDDDDDEDDRQLDDDDDGSDDADTDKDDKPSTEDSSDN